MRKNVDVQTPFGPPKEGISSGNRTTALPRLQIRSGDDRIVAHMGSRLLGDWADRTGWTARLSVALAPLKQRQRGHDRGHVLTQLAVAIADRRTR